MKTRYLLILLLVLLAIAMGSCYERPSDELLKKYVFLIKDYEHLTRQMQQELSECRNEELDSILYTDWQKGTIGSQVYYDSIVFTDVVFIWSDTTATP